MKFFGLNRFDSRNSAGTKRLNLFLFLRIFFFGLIFCFHSISCGQNRAQPAEFINQIFQNYQKENSFEPLGTKADSLFTKNLLKLIRRDQTSRPGEVGNLDFDPICGCQDYNISKIDITEKTVESTSGEVIAHFTNGGIEQSIEFEIQDEGIGWRIADIKSKAVPSIRQMLEKSSSGN